jgi:uncharacterized membrane protein
MEFVPLLAAALLWVGVHVGIAGTRVRTLAVARLGEGGFRIGYSLLSVLCIYLLVAAWQAAPAAPLWFAPNALRWLLAALMLPAFILFVASVAGPNPTAAGQEKALTAAPRGIQRITRHPMLWSFAIWGVVHVLGNGDVASLLFFGAFAVTALVGMPSIDAKLAARAPAAWPALAATTSIVPFAAIGAGRNRLALGEIGWIAPLLGFVAWAALLHFHPAVFGVAAILPG